MPGAGERLEALIREVLDAARRDCHEVAAPLDDLIRALREPLSAADTKKLLDALRSHRCFDAMSRLSDALLAAGSKSPFVRRQYAQALIEKGQTTLAIGMLESNVRSLSESDNVERSETLGLLGRVYKQRFFESSEDRERAAQELGRSIRYYEQAYDLDPAWHGANLVGLKYRAEHDKIPIELEAGSADVAQRLIRGLNERPRDDWTHWTYASAGEAHLALGEWEVAQGYYVQFANHDSVDGFALASAARQLSEVWGIRPDGDDPPSRILAAIQTKAIATPGGEVSSSPRELVQLATTVSDASDGPGDGAFEAILGDNSTVPIGIVLGLARVARSVCQVVDRHLFKNGRKSGGTGFLIDGGTLREDWAGKAVVVTNNHVVSTHGAPPSVRRANADAVFHLWKGTSQAKAFPVDEILAYSPREKLDFSIVSLKAPGPELAEALDGFLDDPDALFPHDAKPPDRVYVVGHPDGRGLEFSLSDNKVIDHQLKDQKARACRLIHYKAPTEKGMSGSPVLDVRELRVVGLHRKGGKVRPLRRVPEPDAYRANEAVWVRSILDALRNRSNGSDSGDR